MIIPANQTLEEAKAITFENLKSQYDYENTIVLLEGKRNVFPRDVDKLVALGRFLTENTRHIRFRSGNAAGADFYFSQGVAAIDKNRLEIVVPQKAHRKKFALTKNMISLEDIDFENNAELIKLSKRNVKTRHLIDGYVAGKRDRFSIKAAYILRDTLKVTGCANILSASFGIFYDDLDNPRMGGTGHTITVCEQKVIPVINQSVWLNWLNIH